MANETKPQEPQKVVVLQIEDFKFLESYIRQINVGYDMIEPAAKVKHIIQSAQIGDYVPKPEDKK